MQSHVFGQVVYVRVGNDLHGDDRVRKIDLRVRGHDRLLRQSVGTHAKVAVVRRLDLLGDAAGHEFEIVGKVVVLANLRRDHLPVLNSARTVAKRSGAVDVRARRAVGRASSAR